MASHCLNVHSDILQQKDKVNHVHYEDRESCSFKLKTHRIIENTPENTKVPGAHKTPE